MTTKVSSEPWAVTHSAETRVTETPNATMTTLASPGLNGTSEICLWTVDFAAGASGPVHTMDREQVWWLERGVARCVVDSVEHELAAGDVIRLAAGVERQFRAGTDARFIVCGVPGTRAATGQDDPGVIPPWIV